MLNPDGKYGCDSRCTWHWYNKNSGSASMFHASVPLPVSVCVCMRVCICLFQCVKQGASMCACVWDAVRRGEDLWGERSRWACLIPSLSDSSRRPAAACIASGRVFHRPSNPLPPYPAPRSHVHHSAVRYLDAIIKQPSSLVAQFKFQLIYFVQFTLLHVLRSGRSTTN